MHMYVRTYIPTVCRRNIYFLKNFNVRTIFSGHHKPYSCICHLCTPVHTYVHVHVFVSPGRDVPCCVCHVGQVGSSAGTLKANGRLRFRYCMHTVNLYAYVRTYIRMHTYVFWGGGGTIHCVCVCVYWLIRTNSVIHCTTCTYVC